MAEKLYSVRLTQSLASPESSHERGDVVEMPLLEARRLVVRGIATELAEAPLPKATAEEMAAARVKAVETAEQIIDRENKLEIGVKVRPLQTKPVNKR